MSKSSYHIKQKKVNSIMAQQNETKQLGEMNNINVDEDLNELWFINSRK
jgi:hypothetical protein